MKKRLLSTILAFCMIMTLLPVTVLAADNTAPVLSATSASDITDTGANLKFTSDEAGTYYYLVLEAADSAPDADTIKAQGTAVTKGTDSATASANTVAVTDLTAETAYKAYVIVVDAASNASAVATIEITTIAASANDDATLSALSIFSGTLNPAFSSSTEAYTATVANSVTSITVTPTVTDIGKATVTVNTTPVNSGSASGSITLNEGENTITVEVTAEDDTTTKTYTIVVTREAPAPLGTLTPSVNTDGDASVSESAGAGNTIKFAVVSGNPASAIASWNVNTTESDINTALTTLNGGTSVTLGTAPTGLDYTSNGKYLVAVEINASSKAVKAGSCAITNLPSAWKITSISAESNGLSGVKRTISFTGTFNGSQYLVVQFTKGSGESAIVTSTCVALTAGMNSYTISTDSTSKAYVLITSGEPNLTGAGGVGVSVYSSLEAKTSSAVTNP